jgi:Tfp pilus assembly pilus retraction ATPase PilT
MLISAIIRAALDAGIRVLALEPERPPSTLDGEGSRDLCPEALTAADIGTALHWLLSARDFDTLKRLGAGTFQFDGTNLSCRICAVRSGDSWFVELHDLAEHLPKDEGFRLTLVESLAGGLGDLAPGPDHDYLPLREDAPVSPIVAENSTDGSWSDRVRQGLASAAGRLRRRRPVSALPQTLVEIDEWWKDAADHVNSRPVSIEDVPELDDAFAGEAISDGQHHTSNLPWSVEGPPKVEPPHEGGAFDNDDIDWHVSSELDRQAGLEMPGDEELWPAAAGARIRDTTDPRGTIEPLADADWDAVTLSAPAGTPGTPALDEHACAASPALEALLKRCAQLGGDTLYLRPDHAPTLRMDEDVLRLDDDPPVDGRVLEALLATSMSPADRQRFDRGTRCEWALVMSGVGVVECAAFRDRHGVSGRFRLVDATLRPDTTPPIPEVIHVMTGEREGLVLVGSTRARQTSAHIAKLVEAMNERRSDHIVTLEGGDYRVHAAGRAMLSQREVRGGPRAQLDAMKSALTDEPDVLVIDDLRTDTSVRLALQAASTGRLVVGGVVARSASEAIGRVVEAFPIPKRRSAEKHLALHLRGVLVQTVVRGRSGARHSARDVLLNTPTTAALIESGEISRLTDRREPGSGLVESIDATLCDLVRAGELDPSDALRRAVDRTRLAEQLTSARAGSTNPLTVIVRSALGGSEDDDATP